MALLLVVLGTHCGRKRCSWYRKVRAVGGSDAQELRTLHALYGAPVPIPTAALADGSDEVGVEDGSGAGGGWGGGEVEVKSYAIQVAALPRVASAAHATVHQQLALMLNCGKAVPEAWCVLGDHV
jgi:hypothetical protein